MTVQIILDDGQRPIRFTYRKVYRGRGLAEVTEGFYMNVGWCRAGRMAQLRGKRSILLQSFGRYTV